LKTLVLIVALVGAKDAPLGKGPIDFRCDAMKAFSDPDRVECYDNVVVRRGGLLLCCEKFEGFANAAGDWEKLICEQNVRAQNKDELMWSQRATFLVAQSDLILTGKPQLHRGKSILNGTRIVVDTEKRIARVEEPNGRVSSKLANPARPPKAMSGALPSTCPLPAQPQP